MATTDGTFAQWLTRAGVAAQSWQYLPYILAMPPMVALRIHDQFRIDLAIRRPVTGVFRENLTDDPAVTG